MTENSNLWKSYAMSFYQSMPQKSHPSTTFRISYPEFKDWQQKIKQGKNCRFIFFKAELE